MLTFHLPLLSRLHVKCPNHQGAYEERRGNIYSHWLKRRNNYRALNASSLNALRHARECRYAEAGMLAPW